MNIETAGYVVGQKIDVKVLGKTETGRYRLSRRAVLLRDNDDGVMKPNNNKSN